MKKLDRNSIRHRDDPMAPLKFSLVVEKGKKGLWYVTSPDMRGLLVAANTWRKAIHAAPKIMTDMFLARQLEQK